MGRRRVGSAGRRRAGSVVKVGIVFFPCSSIHRRPSPLPFFSQGLDLMANGAWRANVEWPQSSFAVSGVTTSSPFFSHSNQRHGLARLQRPYKYETRHLRRATCACPMTLRACFQWPFCSSDCSCVQPILQE
jgi:hypothetical protein